MWVLDRKSEYEVHIHAGARSKALQTTFDLFKGVAPRAFKVLCFGPRAFRKDTL